MQAMDVQAAEQESRAVNLYNLNKDQESVTFYIGTAAVAAGITAGLSSALDNAPSWTKLGVATVGLLGGAFSLMRSYGYSVNAEATIRGFAEAKKEELRRKRRMHYGQSMDPLMVVIPLSMALTGVALEGQ